MNEEQKVQEPGPSVPPLLGICAVQAGGLLGLQFQRVTIEVASRRGPSFFQLAGLAETAVREARIRIASALGQLGLSLEEYALTVNLAPANVRKSGSGLDLGIALAVLGAVGQFESSRMENAIFLGELSLEGALRPIPGVLPLLQGAQTAGIRAAFVPKANEKEAAQVRGIQTFAIEHLSQLLDHLNGTCPLQPIPVASYRPVRIPTVDLKDVRGQESAKRALIVSAAGHHHLLLVGPPGAGKSLLARRLAGLLPPLGPKEALETTAIHSIAGVLGEDAGIVANPPFRAPHHTVSEPGLVGGGPFPRPGEISLAHNGVLFLDEMPEFRRNTLESLRQPLEEHTVHIARARQRTTFPARPLLVSAMNPCPCGNWGNPRAACRCDRTQRLKYLSRISGPLLDRIDLHVMVPPADLRSWTRSNREKDTITSKDACRIVDQARNMQRERHAQGSVGKQLNSLLSLDELEHVALPRGDGKSLLDAAIEKNLLSARGYVRVLRVARTLADLDGATIPGAPHIAEALRYRMSDLAEL